MQPSLNNSPQKVKNILIRHNCCQEVRLNSPFESPEKFHLLKYSPKYYKTLSLEVTNEHPLQSKIKRIKKLKKFKGYFKKILPPKLWLNLLTNTRKEIEETPQITKSHRIWPIPVYWARLTLWKIRFFPNITRVFFPRKKPDSLAPKDYDDAVLIRKPFIGYLRNLRKIKTLEMVLDGADNEEKWMQGKLNGMSQFLNRLENLTLAGSARNRDIQELLKNKDLVSNLTSLTLSPSLKFDTNIVRLLQMSKKLRFLSFDIKWGVNCPEFLEFLTCMRNLPHLVGLEFDFPKGFKKYWSSFKPQAGLRCLKLKFDVEDLIKAGLIGPKAKDTLGHWEDFEKLDELEFSVSCKKIDNLIHLRMFITMLLKKVGKLNSFRCSLDTDSEALDSAMTGEPFLVEEIPHIYDSLQKFEYMLQNSTGDRNQLNFDMKKMKVFRNLTEFKLEGNGLFSDNIEEMVELLERNQKNGDFPTLELQLWSISSSDWLSDILEKISQTKRPERNLKIKIDLRFRIDKMVGNELNFLDNKAVKELSFLDELCSARKSVGFIKGLTICFGFFARNDITPVSVEALREVMRKYSELRNLVVEMGYVQKCLHFRRVDGEEEQLYVVNYAVW